MSNERAWRVSWRMGLPEWFAATAVEGHVSTVSPALALDNIGAMEELWGEAYGIDIAMALAGQSVCIMEYDGMRDKGIVAFEPRSFGRLWLCESESEIRTLLAEAEGKGELEIPIEIGIWLENSTAAVFDYDREGSPYRMSQRNGLLVAEEMPAAQSLGRERPIPQTSETSETPETPE